MKFKILITTLFFSAILGSCSWFGDFNEKPTPRIRIEEAQRLGPPFIAYSLREAAVQFKQNRDTISDLKSLGGITALAGMVYDRDSDDLILVGQAIPNLQSINVDYLTVAFRAVLTHKELPLVSIEPTSTTKKTKLLDVVFQGHIANTSYGKDMLEADIALKKLILGILPATDQGVESYLNRFAENSRLQNIEQVTQSRFWFDIEGEPALSVRNGAIVIRRLRIGAQEEVLYTKIADKTIDNVSKNNAVGFKFSRDLTEAYNDLSQVYPEIARVKTLLDFVALARGVEQLEFDHSSMLDYWLSKHNMDADSTPTTVNLLTEKLNIKDIKGKDKVVELSGGVRLSARVIRLKSGAIGAFRDATLESRPNNRSLFWQVPLNGWKIPDALQPSTAVVSQTDATNTSKSHQGTFIHAEVRSFDSLPFEIPAISPFHERQLPKFKIFDSLVPQENQAKMVTSSSTHFDSKVNSLETENNYAIPEYHKQAKAYIASQESFQQQSPTQRVLFGLPLLGLSPSNSTKFSESSSNAWVRYDSDSKTLLTGDQSSQLLQPAGAQINILISDRGINQYNNVSKLEVGSVSGVIPKFNKATFTYDNHVVYVLPSASSSKTQSDVASDVYTLLNRHSHLENVEIRVVHDVGTVDYLKGGQVQDRVTSQWTGVLLGVNKFRQEQGQANVGLLLGSNAGRHGAAAIQAVHSLNIKNSVNTVFFDDPQVKISSVQKVIDIVGARNVNVFNPSKGGFGDRFRGKGQIASYEPNIKQLALKNPEMGLYKYESKAPGFHILGIGRRHIGASMNPRKIDNISKYDPATATYDSPLKATLGGFIDNHFTKIQPNQIVSTSTLPQKIITPKYYTSIDPALRRVFPQTSKLLTTPNILTFSLPKLRSNIRPGGILLTPKLEIIVGVKGLTNELSQKAVRSFGNGNKSNGIFTHKGKSYFAVKTPKSAKLIQVSAGKFVLQQRDLSLLDGKNSLILDRFYDSRSKKKSPLGLGWSFVPFSLDVSSPKFRGTNKRPILHDWQTGLELEYHLNRAKFEYQPKSRPEQPKLIPEQDGTYSAAFAHGLKVKFGKDGRLNLIQNDNKYEVSYKYENKQLISIISTIGKIDLHYRPDGTLAKVTSSNGDEVEYKMVHSNLHIVKGLNNELQKFKYSNTGHLVWASKQKVSERSNTVVKNTYDNEGRLLTQYTGKGLYKYSYNDKLGQATITNPSQLKTQYYYDGLGRLAAYGSSNDNMTLLNYDIGGHILQVATARLFRKTIGERPRFQVIKVITPTQIGSS